MRICKCGIEFEPRNKKQYLCVDCEKAYRRQRYLANREQIKSTARQYKLNHPEWYRRVSRDYARNHPDKLKKYRSELNYCLSKLVSRAKIASKHSGLVIDINYDYLMTMWEQQQGNCNLTGMSMTHQHNDLRSVSIDRIDSKVGYLKHNIQLVCKWVNLGKNNATNEQMIEIIRELRHGKS